MKSCMVSGCDAAGIFREEVILRGKRMVLVLCELHHWLVRDLEEEKALKREQAAERLRWGDPQRAIG